MNRRSSALRAQATPGPDDPGRRAGLSLRGGGLLYAGARRLGLVEAHGRPDRLAVATAFVTWVPLLVLAAFGDVLNHGPTVPFLHSIGTHARLLVVIPLFFVAEMLFDARADQVIGGIVRAGVIPASRLRQFERALQRTVRWRHAPSTEVAVAILALLSLSGGVRTDLVAGISTWRTTTTGTLTTAGWWYTLVSLPIFQFLFWRWCARFVVWGALLWRLARLGLRLLPTHPDRAGGLGGLGVVHATLAPLAFGASAMIAASCSEQILYLGATADQFVLPVVGGIIWSTLAIIAPLLFFILPLLRVKQDGLIEYGALATGYVRAFDDKWLRGDRPPAEPLLGSADVQSLADMSNSFAVVQGMRIVPMASSQLLLLVAAAALPAVPLVLLAVPLNQLIVEGVRRFLNV